ncbi:phage tail tape measure protein [Xenorhabdus koppenhoeferi]|uniref:Phage tail tape measure protein, lambda family n=1 Tax=Xenorhabdus koppenhoeferi TaxID=351659 RepID=A0A1I7G656_9GAMM|nr:phage tail tape measure protein [Xenorhabdus koppenhoeferi]SFU43914.1 phage tail tape measure protein, lambda family [Xenorhabdus koppenhoeferi]
MTDVATISLKVNTSDLERGEQKLNSFKDAAEKASNSTSKLSSESEKNASASAAMAKEIDRVHRSIAELAAKERQTASASKVLAAEQDKVAEAFFKQIDAIKRNATATEQLTKIQAEARKARQSEKLDLESYRNILSDIIGKKKQMADADAKQSAAGQMFLARLKDQLATQNLSRNELLRHRAAQLGVSSAAEIYINKLKETGKATNGLSGKNKAIISSFKNIASILGMGGLLRGGGIGIVITVVSGITKVAYEAEKEFTQFNKQLILTGNYANKTASQLNEMARVMAGSGITRSEMATSIASVVGTGLFRDNEISRIANAAAQMNYITGQAVETTINQFKRLQDEPLQMSLELEKANHHLTAAQLEQIRTLELQGNTTAAARIAIDAYAQSINDGVNDITDNLGFLESAWVGIQNAAKGAWDEMLNIGRKSTLDDTIREWEEELIEFQTNPASKGIFYYRTGISVDDIKNELETLKEKKFQIDIKNAREQSKKNAEQIEIEKFRIRQKWHNNYASWETHKNEKLAKLEAEKYALTKEQYEEAKKMINYKYRDRKMPGTGKKPPKEPKFKVDAGTRADEAANQALLSLQAQLVVLKEHKTVSDVISAERKKLWDMEAKIAILEEASKTRQLTKDEQSLLLRKESVLASQRELAIYGDKVAIQKKLNDEIDKQRQRTDEIRARGEALVKNAGLSSRLQQRELALSGKKTPQDKKDLEDYYAKEDSMRGNWEAGIQKGFSEFQDKATDVYGNVAQISQFAFEGMSNSLSDFLLTGKADFAGFTKSVLEMITKMLVQMAMLQAMKTALGGTAVGGFLGFAGGGYTGNGGKYEPKGVVHGGEFVFTKEATQRLGIANLYRLMDSAKTGYASGGYVGGSQPVSITQPVQRMYGMQPAANAGGVSFSMGDLYISSPQQQQSSSGNDAAVRREFQQMVEGGVNRMLNNPASALYRTIKGR